MADNYENATPTPTVVDGGGGRFVRGWVVTFTTKPSGLSGEVRVEGDTPDPAAIAAAVTAQAAALETIRSA